MKYITSHTRPSATCSEALRKGIQHGLPHPPPLSQYTILPIYHACNRKLNFARRNRTAVWVVPPRRFGLCHQQKSDGSVSENNCNCMAENMTSNRTGNRMGLAVFLQMMFTHVPLPRSSIWVPRAMTLARVTASRTVWHLCYQRGTGQQKKMTAAALAESCWQAPVAAQNPLVLAGPRPRRSSVIATRYKVHVFTHVSH